MKLVGIILSTIGTLSLLLAIKSLFNRIPSSVEDVAVVAVIGVIALGLGLVILKKK